MEKTIEIFIDKLYKFDRKNEQCSIGFPFPKGEVYDLSQVRIFDENKGEYMPTQMKATSRYEDGSVRFIFIRFLADIPANKKSRFLCKVQDAGKAETDAIPTATFNPLSVERRENGFRIGTGEEDGTPFFFEVKDDSEGIFERISAGKKTYGENYLVGPELKVRDNRNLYEIRTGKWEIVVEGPLCVILKNRGRHVDEETGTAISFELKLSAFAQSPYVEVAYRIINDTDDPLNIEHIKYFVYGKENHGTANNLDLKEFKNRVDENSSEEGPIFKVSNTADCDKLINEKNLGEVRTITASSNYKTNYYVGKDGAASCRLIDHEYLLKEANEHFAEVFYGTFFADYTDKEGGVCATIFQAQQNYPKAVQADSEGITLFIVPDAEDKVVLQSGMSREQRFLLHFHGSEESMEKINDRSIVYQMPYRPYVSPEVHRCSGVYPDIFATEADPAVEQTLIARADGHCRAYGMVNFGDSYDPNYTAQGRGDGKLVWCNNEYDYTHACALLFARTGIRRFLDYAIASASHWMDVDVCHYHKDPLYIGGQWEHTAGHVINGVMVCSHEWVEGLLDYYHFTGDERGLNTALGIGENVLRLLDTPMYAKPGESSARETGWALRSLTALYVETHDKKWLSKCDKILSDFSTWEQQYGHWLSPYTDNTVIRVGFMISVAIGSLMRYYRHFPSVEVKEMILRAVDDMIENCYVESWGTFYYKELPSLNRIGTNTLLLESLTAAYDLSGDSKYLQYGISTFKKAVFDVPSYSSVKKHAEDTVLVGNASSKNFAQSMIPIAGFYRALCEAGIKL